MRTYKVEIYVVLDDKDGDFSEAEVDEIITNELFDVDATPPYIIAMSIQNYTRIE